MLRHRRLCRDSTSVSVARFTRDDWSILRSLRLRALDDCPTALLGDLGEESGWTPSQWQDLVADRVWFGAFVASVPVALVRVVRDPATAHAYVESMWVDEQHRGRNISGLLLLEVESLVAEEGETELRLWVLEGHKGVASIYRSYGFRETNCRQPAPGLVGVEETEFRLLLPSARWLIRSAEIAGSGL